MTPLPAPAPSLASLPPDAPLLAEQAAGLASAYVHVPFCARVCPYCDFAVVAGREDLVDRYLAAVVLEIEQEPTWRPLDAVFLGGGTPSRLSPPQLGSILRALAGRHGLQPDAEVTLEANPEDWSPAMAAGLVEAGFTRVSFGGQSFDPLVLSALGRRHLPEQVTEAVKAARAAGFRSVSVDLIYGTPGETSSSWEETLARALECEPDHVSIYALTVERGTPLSRSVSAGAAAPDPDDQAEKWEVAQARLAEAGLVRYEVSNAARIGHHCRYNLSVWGQGEYLAHGAGAHGFRGGVRRRNVRRVDAYLQRVENGTGPVQGTDGVAGWAAEQERLMLGIRRAAGAVPGAGGRRLLEAPEGRRLVEAGVLEEADGRLVVRAPLLTDEVARAVLSLPPP